MIEPVRGQNPQLGYFFRGASRVVQPRTLRGIGRFLLAILFAAFDRSVSGIRDAISHIRYHLMRKTGRGAGVEGRG